MVTGAEPDKAAQQRSVTVGRIGKPHGVRGQVTLEVRTDDPERRFALGALLDTEPDRGRLEVEGLHDHSGRFLLRLVGVETREAAEALRDTLLSVTPDPREDAGPEAWWDHQLVGLQAVDLGGAALGVVDDVLHPPGNDLLSVRTPDQREVLVPFVAALVPTVDLDGGRVVIETGTGLFEPDEPGDPDQPGE